MSYDPNPIDISGITLGSELVALTERLAENAHDLWARQRLKDGWTYGPQRDDQARKHPCMVPYADLPDAEKEYDRAAVLGTLKAILVLGYTIQAPSTRVETPGDDGASGAKPLGQEQVEG